MFLTTTTKKKSQRLTLREDLSLYLTNSNFFLILLNLFLTSSEFPPEFPGFIPQFWLFSHNPVFFIRNLSLYLANFDFFPQNSQVISHNSDLFLTKFIFSKFRIFSQFCLYLTNSEFSGFYLKRLQYISKLWLFHKLFFFSEFCFSQTFDFFLRILSLCLINKIVFSQNSQVFISNITVYLKIMTFFSILSLYFTNYFFLRILFFSQTFNFFFRILSLSNKLNFIFSEFSGFCLKRLTFFLRIFSLYLKIHILFPLRILRFYLKCLTFFLSQFWVYISNSAFFQKSGFVSCRFRLSRTSEFACCNFVSFSRGSAYSPNVEL